MTDQDLERRLRVWFEADVPGTIAAPPELRRSLAAIVRPRPAAARWHRRDRRTITLLLAAAVTVALVGATIAVGSGLLRQNAVLPISSAQPSPAIGPTAKPVASLSPNPSLPPSPSPVAMLGGGPILAIRPHGTARTCHTTEAPFDVVSVDPGTGQTTLLGTTASSCNVRPFDARWAANGRRILLLDRYSPGQLDLESLTDAGRQTPVVCCGLPTDVWQGGGSSGWGLSPRGDRVAAIHTAPSDLGDAIVVADIDGGNARRIALPKGADARGFAWSPAETTFAVWACLPCNTASRGKPPNAIERWHLYVAPVDGPVVSLVNPAAGSTISQAAWSPDGSVIAAIVTQCGAAQTLPYCDERSTSELVIVDPITAAQRPILAGTDVGGTFQVIDEPSWSPDGGRIRVTVSPAGYGDGPVKTFAVDPSGGSPELITNNRVLAWSPDGRWFLVARDPTGSDIWVGSIDGTPLRELGTFLGVDG